MTTKQENTMANGTILGQVVVGPEAQPVAGALVTLQGPPPRGVMYSVRSRNDGAFAVHHLAPGRWRVATAGTAPMQVEVIDWAATQVVLALARSGTDTGVPLVVPMIDIWREPNPESTWQDASPGCMPDIVPDAASRRLGRGAVLGWVRDARSQAPVADATISCHSSGGSAPDIAPVTDADGRFAIDGLSEGLWILRARAPGGAVGESVVSVRAELRSQLLIELEVPIGPDSLAGML